MKTLNALSVNKLLILLTVYLLSSNQIQAAELQLYSAMGHPYKLLIARSDKVKIIYSEKDETINCRVEVNWQTDTFATTMVEVSKKKFTTKPLASCLPRHQAKTMLANTFH